MIVDSSAILAILFAESLLPPLKPRLYGGFPRQTFKGEDFSRTDVGIALPAL